MRNKSKKRFNLNEVAATKGKYLSKEQKETQEELIKAKEGEQAEKLLKNEAYAFLLAEGLLNKFLRFREYFYRTKTQDALYNLVAEADLGGLWIDL